MNSGSFWLTFSTWEKLGKSFTEWLCKLKVSDLLICEVFYKLWTLIWNDFHYNFLINMVVLNCAYILEETFYYVDIGYYICHCQMLFQYRVKVNLNYICSQTLFQYEIKRTLEKNFRRTKGRFCQRN